MYRSDSSGQLLHLSGEKCVQNRNSIPKYSLDVFDGPEIRKLIVETRN